MAQATTTKTDLRWIQRPWWYGCLLVLLSSTAFGGPFVCIMHCMFVPHHAAPIHHAFDGEEALHREHGNADHTPSPATERVSTVSIDCWLDVQSGHSSASEEPTPLTIAVILVLPLAGRTQRACRVTVVRTASMYAITGHPDGQTFAWIKHGITGSGMPACASILDDDEIWNVGHYSRTFAEVGSATSEDQPPQSR